MSDLGRAHPYRKAYSCAPCRAKKIRCGRQLVCEQCKKKKIECVWPPNGIPIASEPSGSTPTSSATSPETSRHDHTNSTVSLRTSAAHGGDRSANTPLWSGYRPIPSHSAHQGLARSRAPEHLRSPAPSAAHQQSTHLDDEYTREVGGRMHPSRTPRESLLETSPVAGIPHTVALAEQFDHSILNDPVPATRLIRAHEYAGDDKAEAGDEAASRRSDSRSRSRSRFPFKSRTRQSSQDGMVNDELLKALPLRYRADILLRFYIERVEWIHHPLHLPTFLQQYNRFWQLDAAARKKSVHSRWLALLYIVLCLGAYFGEEDTDEDRALLVACEDCLSHSDFLNQSSVEAIQTVICLNLYLNNNDQSWAAKSFLSLAIKMAISLGLSRIPREADLPNPLEGQLEREMGRRLWWSVVCQDAYTASNTGFTYTIHLGHATTEPFANLDDEEIGLPGLRERPRDDRITVSTYHLAKIQFALIVRDFIDAINLDFPNASYESILALDARFRKAYENLPTALRPDIDQPFNMSISGSGRYLFEQRLFMGITLHNRLMRLHRAYMRRGYVTANETGRHSHSADSRANPYAYSTQACIDSAIALLSLARQSGVLCRWWVVVVHIWTAGLILSADSLRVTIPSHEAQRNQEGVELAVSLLESTGITVPDNRPMSKNSPVAARGIKILKSLLADDLRRRSKRSKGGSTYGINGSSSALSGQIGRSPFQERPSTLGRVGAEQVAHASYSSSSRLDTSSTGYGDMSSEVSGPESFTAAGLNSTGHGRSGNGDLGAQLRTESSQPFISDANQNSGTGTPTGLTMTRPTDAAGSSNIRSVATTSQAAGAQNSDIYWNTGSTASADHHIPSDEATTGLRFDSFESLFELNFDDLGDVNLDLGPGFDFEFNFDWNTGMTNPGAVTSSDNVIVHLGESGGVASAGAGAGGGQGSWLPGSSDTQGIGMGAATSAGSNSGSTSNRGAGLGHNANYEVPDWASWQS